MTSKQLKMAREQRGLTQKQAAPRLGVSQPYLSLLESGERPVSESLARKAAELYDVPAYALPLNPNVTKVRQRSESLLARDLSALGYPGFSYLKPSHRRNPAETLLSAMTTKHLDSRLMEALPWVLFKYPNLNWDWLIEGAQAKLLQNKLGFLTNLARRVAERNGDHSTAALLREKELSLEGSLLLKEEPLGNSLLRNAERQWLEVNRSAEAKNWRVLTDLVPEHFSYVR